MKRYPAGYVRKSKRLEESAAAQLAAIKEVAARDGVNGDLQVYADVGVSGRYGKRGEASAWQRLQDDIAASRVSTVYISVLDRAGRSLEDWLAFARRCNEQGVRIVDQTGQDRATDEGHDLTVIEMLFAEREGKKAVERAARGMVTKAKRGDTLGVPPYGMVMARDDEGRVVHVPNPAEPVAVVVATVRETGGNVLAATRLLNERGVPTRLATAVWSPKSVAKIVRREEPRMLLRTLAKPRRVGDELRPPAPLAKIVVCHCGTVMTPRPKSGSLYCYAGIKRGEAHGRYVARARHVLDLLRSELPRVRRIPILKADANGDAEKRAKLEEELRRLGRAYRAGAVDDDEFDTETERLRAELDRLGDDDAEWIGFGPARLTVDFDGDPTELGEALRQRVRAVHLDEQMMPARVEWR